MADPDAVATALARLANGDTQQVRTEPTTAVDRGRPPASVVADAEAAVTRLDTAAAFLDGGGEQRLQRAVERADRDGAVAERGRDVLAALDRFRRAAEVKEPS
jgi:hypothetical protein